MAHYSCEEGYVLHGGDMRYCQQDGGWSGAQTICKGKFRWKDQRMLKLNLNVLKICDGYFF